MLRPLSDRILVERLAEETTTKGGIIIPDTAKEKPQKAKVIAVGTGKRAKDGQLIEMTVKTGDVVIFGKYSGTEVKMDGHDYLIMREDDILGIVEA